MATGFRPKQFGLFGAPGGMTSPFEQPGMQQYAQQMPAPPPEPEKRWLDGGKFKARDGIALALGAIGDTFTGRPSTSQMILSANHQRQQMERAKQLREQSMQDAQMERMQGLQDYRTKKGIDAEFATPSGDEYTYFEDNAGNRWRQHKATGAVDANPTFIDRTPKEFVHEGMRFSIQNPYLRGQEPAPVAADEWDNAKPLGGGAPSGTAMFP